MPTPETLRLYCKRLRLPTMAAVMAEMVATAERESWSLETTLLNLLEQELAGRSQRRISRLLKLSQLPAGKTLDQLDWKRLPLRAQRQLSQLATGDFAERAANALFFCLPGGIFSIFRGSGKAHVILS